MSDDPTQARMLELLEGMDARLQRLEASLGAAPVQVVDPAAAATLARLSDRMDRLDAATRALGQLPDLAAGAVDTIDGFARAAAAQGADVDARLRATLTLAERLTRPELVEALLVLTEDPAALRQAAEAAKALPGGLAMAVDTLDTVAGALQARGIDLHARGAQLLRALEALTDPAIVGLLEAVLARGPDLTRLVHVLLESGVFDEAAVQMVGTSGKALVQTRGSAAPVGPLGALAALTDPDVQRTLGFTLAFARAFGRALAAPASR
jgi:uncharacterized protein YjgD (DUF1641 family)